MKLAAEEIDFAVTTAPSLMHIFPVRFKKIKKGEHFSQHELTDILGKMGQDFFWTKGELVQFSTYREFSISLPFNEIEEIRTGELNSLSFEKEEEEIVLPTDYSPPEEAMEKLSLKLYLVDPLKIKTVLEAVAPEIRSNWQSRILKEINSILSRETPYQYDSAPTFKGDISKLRAHIENRINASWNILLVTREPEFLEFISKEFTNDLEIMNSPVELSRKIIKAPVTLLSSNWLLSGELKEEMIEVLNDRNIFGRRQPPEEEAHTELEKPPAGTKKITRLSSLREGDTVVHPSMGIAIFKGLQRIQGEDFVKLEFADGKAYLPIPSISKLFKFHGDNPPAPTKMGAKGWRAEIERLRKSVETFVKDLLRLHAVREISKRPPYPPDGEEMWQFIAEFPHEETPDQSKAWIEVKRDLEAEYPMDRLILGDTGYGKTEIAMRAAFKVVLAGKQVAFLVPTTLLAIQQYDRFRERFKNFPVRIELLSRFTPSPKVREILKGLKAGKVDIIVGTHRLLSNDVKFKDLGLLIVDDEHKFGVRHKEKLKMLKKDVDYLGMSATPIPRSFHMALSGISKLSVVETPPPGRKQIKVLVEEFSWDKAVNHLENYFRKNPGEKVFWVEPRIEDIERVKENLVSLFGEKSLVVAHGRMKEEELEESLYRFVVGEARIMLSTAIIEAGLDLEGVDLIIVDNAQKFGIAQLYQLRGRVGRRERPATAIFFYPKGKLTESARKRLKMLERASSGFEIAYSDLEMRGPGSLFGYAQHGHFKYISSELYIEMINEEIAKAKGEELLKFEDIKLKLRSKLSLPEELSEQERVRFYRAIFSAHTPQELGSIRKELIRRLGFLPEETENLLKIREFLTKIIPVLKNYEEKELIEEEDKIILTAKKGKCKVDWEISGGLENLYELEREILKSQTP